MFGGTRMGIREMFGETEQAGPKRENSFAELGESGVASDKNKRQREPLSESDGDDYGCSIAERLQRENTEAEEERRGLGRRRRQIRSQTQVEMGSGKCGNEGAAAALFHSIHTSHCLKVLGGISARGNAQSFVGM